MKALRQFRHDAGKRGMHEKNCPNCGSGEIVPRTVNDLLRAVDPRGEIFEVGLKLPVWSCKACKLCWQGQEALAAKETAYQIVLLQRLPSRQTA